MSGHDNDDDQPVGYCKPPRHSQFKPGQSGNPAGRPRGSKKLKTDNALLRAVAKLFDEKVPSIKRGKAVEVPLVEAMAHALAKKAATGDPKSVHWLLVRQANDEAKREAAKEAEAEVRGGLLIVPKAPKTIEEWTLLYGDKASGAFAKRLKDTGAWDWWPGTEPSAEPAAAADDECAAAQPA
jgi:hypothetical protein